ncbi:MAG: DUF2336 domain-containing protein [Xanthobacteraceae bacterium]
MVDTVAPDLIDLLENAVADGDIARRALALRSVTDLFMLGTGRFSSQQVDLFDDVMRGLLHSVDVSVKAGAAARLAAIADPPPGTMRDLALDDAIEVAGPVLSHSDRNAGASISAYGYSELVDRARRDVDLSLSVWARPDLPRASLVKLFMDASNAVRGLREAQDPAKSAVLREVVAEASGRLLIRVRSGSVMHAEAVASVQALRSAGKLDEVQLVSFATSLDFDRTAVALSLLCDLPIEVIERVFLHDGSEQLLIMAKAIGLSWEATKAILLLRAGPTASSIDEIERAFISFTRLRPKTARTAIEFYRLRERANVTSPPI